MDVLLVGGGMITHDQLLPSIWQLKRAGRVHRVTICSLGSGPLKALAESPSLREAFPEMTFEAIPPLDTPGDQVDADAYRHAIDQLDPRQLVVVAVPDHVHGEVIHAALEADQHVLSVKPLVPTFAEGMAIERAARERGLFVGIEYHKRFDRRSLDARGAYRSGRLGRFRCGEARMIEPYSYRHSNFQNWFTKENSDPFTYVGCHYVDLVYFITGLKPVEVSVRGVEGTFPNGNEAFLWSAGTVVWENGAVLTVLDGLGYPDHGAGMNDQGLSLYCEGPHGGGVLRHDDQFRGVSQGYVGVDESAPFRFINPDYFRLVPHSGIGLKPVGYGYDSVEALFAAAESVNASSAESDDGVAARQAELQRIDQTGLLATPANSSINEQVTEAARRSITDRGAYKLVRET